MTGTICGPPSVHLPYTAHRHTGVSARSVHGTLLCHYCRQCQMHLRHATLFHWITVARRVYAFSLPLCIRRNVEHGMGVNHPPPVKITDRLFRYASPRLWNQLPDSFRQPHYSCLDSPPHPLLNSSLSSSTLSSSITPSLFHSKLKTYLFNKCFPP